MLKTIYQRIPDQNGYLYGMDCRGQRLYRYSVNINGYIFDHQIGRVISRCWNKSGWNSNSGCYTVDIVFPNGSTKAISLHLIIAENFLPITEDDVLNNRDKVTFKSEDRGDCSVFNLIRMSGSEIAKLNYARGNGRHHKSRFTVLYPEIDKDLANMELSIKDIYNKWHPICGITYNTISRRASNLGYIRKTIYSDDIKKYAYKLIREGLEFYNVREEIKMKFGLSIPEGTLADWFKYCTNNYR